MSFVKELETNGYTCTQSNIVMKAKSTIIIVAGRALNRNTHNEKLTISTTKNANACKDMLRMLCAFLSVII